MVLLARYFAIAHESPAKAATDKIPTMARTASISKRVLPDWGDIPDGVAHRRGERERGSVPPICNGTARPNFFGGAEITMCRPERSGRGRGKCTPAVKKRPINTSKIFPRVAPAPRLSRVVPRSAGEAFFLKRLANLNCLKNAVNRPLSLFRGGGGKC